MNIIDRFALASHAVEKSDFPREGVVGRLVGQVKDGLNLASQAKVFSSGSNLAMLVRGQEVGAQAYSKQITTIPADEWGAGPSWVNPYTYGQSLFAHNALIGRFGDRRHNAAYKDYIWSRRIGFINFVVSLQPALVITGDILYLAKKVADYFKGMSVSTSLNSAGSKLSGLASSPVGKVLAKAMPWVMIGNGIIQIKRKLGILSEINKFLDTNERLKDSLPDWRQRNTKKFLNKLKEEYFTLYQAEIIDINASAQLTDKEKALIEREARGDEQTYNRMVFEKKNEKIEIAKAHMRGDKLHNLRRIIGQEATQALAEGDLEFLIANVDNQDEFTKVFESTQKIIAKAETKKTAEKIDILVQGIFLVVGIGMLFGSPFTGLMILGMVLWIGLVIYTKRNLGKVDFKEGIEPAPKKNTQSNGYLGYSPELYSAFDSRSNNDLSIDNVSRSMSDLSYSTPIPSPSSATESDTWTIDDESEGEGFLIV